MKPPDKTADKLAGAQPGAESAEVRKASIHAGLRGGGKCGKSAEEVRNLSLFIVSAGLSNPAPVGAADPGPAAYPPPVLVAAHRPKTRRESGPRQPPTPGGSGLAAHLACDPGPEAHGPAGLCQVLTHPAFDRPPVHNVRRPGPKAGAVSLAIARHKKRWASYAAALAQTNGLPSCDVLADAIQHDAGRSLTACELDRARTALSGAAAGQAEQAGEQPAGEQRIVLVALAILDARIRKPGPTICGAADVRQFLALHMVPRDREAFGVLFLDAENRLIRFEVLFTGRMTQTAVPPREVVRRALALNAAAVVLAHNHPSGCPKPSPDDVRLTAALQTALRLVGVRVLDHLVIGWPEVVSFADLGML